MPRAKLVSTNSDTRTLEQMVSFYARVSSPANQTNFETSEKLIKYLMDNKHWSPFEMVNICMEINTTRDIGRQILRHRSFSFQEFSQRYSKIDEKGISIREARLQDAKNRQASLEVDDEELQTAWQKKQASVVEQSIAVYQWALKNGIAKEQARAVLPEGLVLTRMYMNGSLRSWIHYLQVRTKHDTQKEHREVAMECLDEIAKVFPLIRHVV